MRLCSAVGTGCKLPRRWIQYYQQLMTGIVGMGAKYQNAVMVDILNEPDARGLS